MASWERGRRLSGALRVSWRAEGSWEGLGGSGHLAGVVMHAIQLLVAPEEDDKRVEVGWAGEGKLGRGAWLGGLLCLFFFSFYFVFCFLFLLFFL